MERKAFTISRATWWRGKTAFGSKLLIRTADSERPLPPETLGKMCCLGSIALQCGATEDQIADVDTPARLGIVPNGLLPLVEGPRGLFVNSELAQKMMEVNDHPGVSGQTREAELTRLAATIGWDLTFTD